MIELEWQKPEDTAAKTVCGRYSCCRVMVEGKPQYELWKLVPGGAWFAPLANKLESFEAAKGIAEQDVNRGFA